MKIDEGDRIAKISPGDVFTWTKLHLHVKPDRATKGDLGIQLS